MKASEILKQAKKENMKYIRLIRPDNSIVVGFNTPSVTIETRAGEIEQMLKSDLLPDGIYYLCFHKSPKSDPFKFEVYKGEKGTKQNEGGRNNGGLAGGHAVGSENITSYNSVLELNVQLVKVTIERDQLLERVALLEAELNDDEGLNDDETTETMGDRAVGWLKEMAVLFAPAIDKYQEQQDRILTMKEAELYQKIKVPDEVIDPMEVQRAYDYLLKFKSTGDQAGAEAWLTGVQAQYPKFYIELQKLILQKNGSDKG